MALLLHFVCNKAHSLDPRSSIKHTSPGTGDSNLTGSVSQLGGLVRFAPNPTQSGFESRNAFQKDSVTLMGNLFHFVHKLPHSLDPRRRGPEGPRCVFSSPSGRDKWQRPQCLRIRVGQFVHPEGLEPPTTDPKSVMISTSPRVQYIKRSQCSG